MIVSITFLFLVSRETHADLLPCPGREQGIFRDRMDDVERHILTEDGRLYLISLIDDRSNVVARLFQDLSQHENAHGEVLRITHLPYRAFDGWFILVDLPFGKSPACRVLPSFDKDDLPERGQRGGGPESRA